ncbi:MAG: beta-ribofuranosylaminobenzene 5'-phosphate synthase family protein [Burkholderiaceae bacterium]
MLPESTGTPNATRRDTRSVVSVAAPGRLHLGFLDPAGTLGRHFGSLGLTIEGFETELELAAAKVDRDGVAADRVSADTSAARAEIERVAQHLQRLRERTGRRQPLTLHLRQTLPAHAGFGSGTQLALAVGHAFARWHGLDLSSATLARWLARGHRSGVGIAAFDAGGLLLDGGPGAHGAPAPLLARLAWPSDWRIVVVLDAAQRGLSGHTESDAIAALPAMPQAQAADLCHQVLMRILPSAASGEFVAFAAGVNHVQERLGAHFAPAQGNSAWTSPAVGRCMQWLRTHFGDAAAIGQSSWGPTGFACVPSAQAAQHLIGAAREAGVVDASLELRSVAGRNHGAVLGGAALR